MYDPTLPTCAHPRPTRFSARTVEHTLWESVVWFWRYGTWQRRRRVFEPLQEGDPRYASAPFEEKFFGNPQALKAIYR